MANEPSKYQDMLDIIFEDRNKAYGAYVLRREYPKYLTRAVIYMFAGLVLIFAAPYILASVAGAFAPQEKPIDIEVEMGPPPDIDPNTPPPPPPPPVETPPPPVRTTQAFVPPVVKKDEEVKDEKIQDVEEIVKKDVDIGKTDVQGDDKAEIKDPEPVAPPVVEEKKPAPVQEDVVHDYVEKPPAFPGGEAELLKFLNQNIKYPPLAKESNIQGRVILSFVVNKKGNIEDVRVVKDIGGGCGKEAMRVVESMPSWNPGEQNGHPVKVRYTLPVLFRLE